MGASGSSSELMLEDPRVLLQRHLPLAIQKLQTAAQLEEVLSDAASEILAAFNADRVTVYAVTEDKLSIVSKIKTGLRSFKDLKLPIGEHSIAGFVALSGKRINIRDAYDQAELAAHAARLRFLGEVDKRTGYRTTQVLAAPIPDPEKGDVIGVVQLLNSRGGVAFPTVTEEAAGDLARHIGAALKRSATLVLQAKSKYDQLIIDRSISAANFELASRAARKRKVDVEQVLIEEFSLTREQIGAALAKYFGVPYEAFKPDRMKPLDLLKNIRREYAEANHWLPLDDTNEGVKILALDPERVRATNVAKNVLGRARALYVVTTLNEFQKTLDQYFGSIEGDIGDLLTELDADAENPEEHAPSDDASDAAQDNELVKLVNKVIIDAYSTGASDIHVESYPGKGKTEIRFRRDGTLVPYFEVPPSYRRAIVARIKIMCDLDISERRKPQDGKIQFKRFGPLDIELRVATIPVAGGMEDVVMRVLAAGEPIPLEKLGLLSENLEAVKQTVSKPYGLFFVCGPTGSGKTTTLHSILGHLNTPETKIWTAEDPVEITQKGLRQVQVNRKAGMDFATVMRAFLRADPDIIMVGEMRDKETTSIGVEASLTGHLVFATLHTNSAPESIIRLLDMGMDPFNFADALLGVLAQRLAKRLCEKCKQSYVPESTEIRQLLTEYCQEMQHTTTFKRDSKAAADNIYKQWLKKYGDDKGLFKLYRKVGCDTCLKTGYKGRAGLHELLVASDGIKKMIQEKARVAEILAVALEEGMRTLKMDGIEKVLGGVTDIVQVRHVCIK
jgi:type II secretory ATPase GspE/PulE/Tfp pilus assembly ATPase PilB-like protein